MESAVLILSILPVHVAMMISPGPNFLVLSSVALANGRREAVMAAFGVAIGSLIWMAAAAAGISVVLDAQPLLGFSLKVLGGLYLVYLGFRMWTSASTNHEVPQSSLTMSSSFLRGLMVNLSSPKSAAYFGSVFAAFLSSTTSIFAVVVLVVTLFTTSVIWHCAVATSLSSAPVRRSYLDHSKAINRVSGAILFLLGLRLVGSSFDD